MFPISQAIVPITCVVLVPPPKPSPPDYQLDNLILMGIYVFLTLVVAIGAIVSIFITRASLKASSIQSEAALAASKKQSDDAIAAVNRQIDASEQQAREATYNQYKPIIVPILLMASGDHIGVIQVQNKGTGVALNVWGFLTLKENPTVHYFVQRYFLAPDEDKTIQHFNINLEYPLNLFEGYPLFLRDDDGNITYDCRLMMTYEDAFDNIYLAIFDYSNELKWKHVELRKVSQRLDEFVGKINPSTQQKQ